MKKNLVILSILSSILFSQEYEKITIGAGAYLQTQPYKGVKSIVVPTPVIFYDNSIFYVRWTRVGAYFLGDKSDDFSWGLSLTAQPRFYGYDNGDIQGMDKRKDSWEGGLALSMKKDASYLELTLLTDLLRNNSAYVVTTELGHELKFGKFSLYPSIFFNYLSNDFTNYYYGIKPHEAARRAESPYFTSSGYQIGAQSYIEYPLTKQFSALFNLKAEKLPSSATNSTLVSDDYIYSGLASLIYTFEY